MHTLFGFAVFDRYRFQGQHIAGLFAQSATDAGLCVDRQGIIALGNAVGESPIHSAEKFTAAGAAVANERRFMPDIISDMRQMQIPSPVNHGQQFVDSTLLSKTAADHEPCSSA